MIAFLPRAAFPGIGRSFTPTADGPADLSWPASSKSHRSNASAIGLRTSIVSLEQPTVSTCRRSWAIRGSRRDGCPRRSSPSSLFGLTAPRAWRHRRPVFIPFFPVPQTDWMFWGWLKSLLQHAFYQVIAQAFVFVFGTFTTNFHKTRFRRPPSTKSAHSAASIWSSCWWPSCMVIGSRPLTNSLCRPVRESSLPRICEATMATTPSIPLPPTGYEYGEARRRYVEATRPDAGQ